MGAAFDGDGAELVEDGAGGGVDEVAAEGDLDPEVLVFLNNDIHVDEGFLRELVAPVVRGEAVATTAKMMSWDGKVLNSAAGGMNFHGIGNSAYFFGLTSTKFCISQVPIAHLVILGLIFDLKAFMAYSF